VSQKLKEQFKQISEDFNSKFFNSGEPKICELHDLLDQGAQHHNCIACNLASNYNLIQKHLNKNQHLEDLEYAYSSTILLYYLLLEKFFAIFGSIEKAGLQATGYKNSHYTMRKIWSWANFLKHPKAFMYVHDPEYFNVSEYALEEVENTSEEAVDQTLVTALIDDDFVKTYYMGGGNNPGLYEQLKNKSNVLVVFPNFMEINEGLKKEIGEFEELVKNNPGITEHLHQEATILEFWEEE